MPRPRRVGLLTLLFGVLFALLTGSAAGQGSDSPAPGRGAPAPRAKLESSLARLLATYETFGLGQAALSAQSEGVTLQGDSIRVIVEARPGGAAEAVAATQSTGGAVERTYDNLIQASAPISSLEALAASDAVRLVRKPLKFLPLAVASEGVGVSGVAPWRSAGLTGTGVKVAVVDLSFTGYLSARGTELPSTVVARSFRSDGLVEDPELDADEQRHGTAAAEIVYDMAPGAQLYLVAFDTDVELATAVDWLIAEGVNIVSYSLGNPLGGAGDGTGPVNDIVTRAADAGILWVNAAGNETDRHWSAKWTDADGDGFQDFSPGGEGNTIDLLEGEHVEIDLKWNDPFDASCNDYNLDLYDSLGFLVAFSINVQDCYTFPPVEMIEFVAPYSDDFSIGIQRFDADGAARFDLYVDFDCLLGCPSLEYVVPAGSIVPPADNPAVLAVGAVPWNSPNTIEDFSSQGPTTDGRIKPDLVAPDRVSTSSYGAYSLWSPGFGGTSASAPHVAGAAALVKQANPTWSWADIKAFLESRAIDLGAGGKDNVYGAGRLSLGSVPSPTPTPTPTPTPEPTVAEQLASIDGKYSIVYGFDPAAQAFRKYVPGRPEMSDLSKLEVGSGYLILASEDATLSYAGHTWPIRQEWSFVGWY